MSLDQSDIVKKDQYPHFMVEESEPQGLTSPGSRGWCDRMCVPNLYSLQGIRLLLLGAGRQDWASSCSIYKQKPVCSQFPEQMLPRSCPVPAAPGPVCRGPPSRWRETPRLLRGEKWIEKRTKQSQLDGISILECGNQ